MSLQQSDKRAPMLTIEFETVLISPCRHAGRVKEQVEWGKSQSFYLSFFKLQTTIV